MPPVRLVVVVVAAAEEEVEGVLVVVEGSVMGGGGLVVGDDDGCTVGGREGSTGGRQGKGWALPGYVPGDAVGRWVFMSITMIVILCSDA